MLFENVDRFEEIPEVYGVFPLKEDYLAAGTAALKKFGVHAEVEDGIVRIPFADRLLFGEDDYAFREDNWEIVDRKDWRMKITACISLNQSPEEGIREVWCEYNVTVPPEDDCGEDYDLYYEPSTDEHDQAYDLIEIFLNKAVDAA